jgi:hypothetical protein
MTLPGTIKKRTKMVESTCISCKFFRMKDALGGVCRAEKNLGQPKGEKPAVEIGFSCDEWQDCGQQYYIRLGWIKSQNREADKD